MTDMNEIYKGWMKLTNQAIAGHENGRRLSGSKEPEVIAEARTNLEAIVGSNYPNLPLVTLSDSKLLGLANEISSISRRDALSLFVSNGAKLLQEIKRSEDEKATKKAAVNKTTAAKEHRFTRGWLNIAPSEKVRGYDPLLIKSHYVHYGLASAIREIIQAGVSSPLENANFIGGTTELIAAEAQMVFSRRYDAKFLNSHESKDESELENAQESADRLAGLIAGIYATLSPEQALVIVQAAANRSKKRCEAILSQDERAKYVKDILDARLFEAKEEFAKDRERGRAFYNSLAENIYRIVE